MNIGDRVKALRKEKGITQQELADLLGYKSKSTITHIEKGRDIPRSVVVSLANALNTTPAYLMGWENEKPPEPQITEKQADAIKLICSLSPEEFDKTEEFVKFIISQRENKSLD